MKIKYLGTAAYEGIPALFCKCAVCSKARKAGGRNVRSRSQAIINDELLMDFPPDTVWHSNQFGLDWSRINNCLITHSHSDHLYPEDVDMLGSNYSGRHNTLCFYVGQSGYDQLYALMQKPEIQENVKLCLAKPKKSFLTDGERPYRVLPLSANHDPATSPVIYSISQAGKSILYAHDTGIFPEETWEMLAGEKRFDLISLDCTGGLDKCGEWRDGHMNLETNLEVVERLRREGLADQDTVFVMNHFSHHGEATYEEMASETEKYGFITAYDGLELEF